MLCLLRICFRCVCGCVCDCVILCVWVCVCHCVDIYMYDCVCVCVFTGVCVCVCVWEREIGGVSGLLCNCRWLWLPEVYPVVLAFARLQCLALSAMANCSNIQLQASHLGNMICLMRSSQDWNRSLTVQNACFRPVSCLKTAYRLNNAWRCFSAKNLGIYNNRWVFVFNHQPFKFMPLSLYE